MLPHAALFLLLALMISIQSQPAVERLSLAISDWLEKDAAHTMKGAEFCAKTDHNARDWQTDEMSKTILLTARVRRTATAGYNQEAAHRQARQRQQNTDGAIQATEALHLCETMCSQNCCFFALAFSWQRSQTRALLLSTQANNSSDTYIHQQLHINYALAAKSRG